MKTIKFRRHRELLTESMETVIEVSSLEEIKIELNRDGFPPHWEELKFSDYKMWDSRIDWDTYYVLGRLKGKSEFWVVGMSNGVL